MKAEVQALALDITISREESVDNQTNNKEGQENMDWTVVEGEEHAFLDRLKMELEVGLLEDEDWNIVDLESENEKEQLSRRSCCMTLLL